MNLPCLILRYHISICVKPRHRQRTVVRFPVQAADSCFLLSVQTGSSDPKASYSLGTRGAFPGSEVARASCCHSHPNYNQLFGAAHCLWHEFHLFTSHNSVQRFPLICASTCVGTHFQSHKAIRTEHTRSDYGSCVSAANITS